MILTCLCWILTDRNRVDNKVFLLVCNIFPSMLDHNQHNEYNWHAKDDRELRRSIGLELGHDKQHKQRTSSETENEEEKNVQNQSEFSVKKKRKRAEVKPLSLFSLSRTRR